MVRRTKAEAEKTRDLILDTAEVIFHEKGVARTSLNDIAGAAGVTRGAIYWHFKNKADLFDAMIRRMTLPVEATPRLSDSDDDPIGFVRNCAVSILKRVASDQQSQRILDIISHKCEYVDEMAQIHERRAASRAECLKKIEDGIRNAINKKQLPESLSPRYAAVGLHALIDGLIRNWIIDKTFFPLEKQGEKIIDAYINGLRT
jgi:TetR/AcrR family acrAB operon transcriptional repressor